ncbi:MAG: acyltransferase [Clostridia bacterium]|nr:acyltransferase [Clostridia bacterium]
MSLQKEKNYGIELLRIVAIVMVFFLHVLGQGGVYPYSGLAKVLETQPWNYRLSWLLETASYGAVDLFALISGYVGVKSTYKTKRFANLWLLVVFWGVTMVLLIDKLPVVFSKFNDFLGIFIPDVKLVEFGKVSITSDTYYSALFPLSNKQYWYFNAYALTYLLSPILNKALNTMEKADAKKIVIAIFLFPSILAAINNADLFVTGYGYSAIWLICLYVIGGYIRLHNEEKKIPKPICFLGYLLSTLCAWGYRLLIDRAIADHPENELLPSYRSQFIQYTSPFILLGAVFLLLLFKQIRIKHNFPKKLIGCFSSTSFGMYIIHVQPVFWQYFMYLRFWRAGYYDKTPQMLAHVVLAVILLYFTCFALEKLRQLIFKYSFIDKLTDMAGDGIDKLINLMISDKDHSKKPVTENAEVSEVKNEEQTTLNNDIEEKKE